MHFIALYVQGSLHHILSTRPGKILAEDFIAIVLKQALIALRDQLHTDFIPRAHKTLNVGDIFVHIGHATDEMFIKLAFEASVYDPKNINAEENSNLEEVTSSSTSFLYLKGISNWGAALEVYGIKNAIRGPKSDIWLLGITTLELSYGDLPVRSHEDLDLIIRNIRKKKKLPRSLEKLLIINKKKGKFQKTLDLFKPKENVFPKKFERLVLKCLSENPEKRLTVEQLLTSSFFTMQRDIEKFRRFVLNNPDPYP